MNTSTDSSIPTISEAAIADYDQQGVVGLRGVFAERWLELLARGVERNMAEPGPYAKRYTPEGAPGLFFGDYCNWQRIAEYRQFLMESPAAGIAGQRRVPRRLAAPSVRRR